LVAPRKGGVIKKLQKIRGLADGEVQRVKTF
jgi:hypothetical protein